MTKIGAKLARVGRKIALATRPEAIGGVGEGWGVDGKPVGQPKAGPGQFHLTVKMLKKRYFGLGEAEIWWRRTDHWCNFSLQRTS